MSENSIFQKKNAEYLPETSQLNSEFTGKYLPHKSTRYINVFIGNNGIAKRNNSDNKLLECEKDLPELYTDRQDCCGCGGCYSICPMSGKDRPQSAVRKGSDSKNLKYIFSIGKETSIEIEHTGAITMMPDEEGFLYPVVDAQICIRCLKCINVCAFKKDLK